MKKKSLTPYAVLASVIVSLLAGCATAKVYFPNEQGFPEYRFSNEKKRPWDKDAYAVKDLRFTETLKETKNTTSGDGYSKREYSYSRDTEEAARVTLVTTKNSVDTNLVSISSETSFMKISYGNRLVSLDFTGDGSFKEHYLPSGTSIRYEKSKESFQGGKKYALWGSVVSGFKVYLDQELLAVLNLLNDPSLYLNEGLYTRLSEDDIDQVNIELMSIFIMSRTPEL